MNAYLLLSVALMGLGIWGCKPETSRSATANRTEADAIFWKRFLSYNQTQWEVSGQLIPDDLPLFDPQGNNITLQDLLTERPTVIFRFTDADCDSCLGEVFGALQVSYDPQANPALLLIASYKQFDTFLEFWNDSTSTLPVYYLPPTSASGPFQTEYLPFLFLTNASRQILYPFVPPAEHPGSTTAYWRFIQRQIGSQQQTVP